MSGLTCCDRWRDGSAAPPEVGAHPQSPPLSDDARREVCEASPSQTRNAGFLIRLWLLVIPREIHIRLGRCQIAGGLLFSLAKSTVERSVPSDTIGESAYRRIRRDIIFGQLAPSQKLKLE